MCVFKLIKFVEMDMNFSQSESINNNIHYKSKIVEYNIGNISSPIMNVISPAQMFSTGFKLSSTLRKNGNESRT